MVMLCCAVLLLTTMMVLCGALLLRGTVVNRDLRHAQKPTWYQVYVLSFFRNNIWSYLRQLPRNNDAVVVLRFAKL